MAATHLNDQQFAEMANAGGASRRMADSKRPTSGLMVGVPGLEKRYPPPVQPYQVAHHRTLVAIHAGLGAGEYQGAWKTEHAGGSVVVLDHSKRFPDSPSGETLARRRGEAGHQDALWRVKGLDAGEEIPLHSQSHGQAPTADYKISGGVGTTSKVTTPRGTTVVFRDRR